MDRPRKTTPVIQPDPNGRPAGCDSAIPTGITAPRTSPPCAARSGRPLAVDAQLQLAMDGPPSSPPDVLWWLFPVTIGSKVSAAFTSPKISSTLATAPNRMRWVEVMGGKFTEVSHKSPCTAHWDYLPWSLGELGRCYPLHRMFPRPLPVRPSGADWQKPRGQFVELISSVATIADSLKQTKPGGHPVLASHTIAKLDMAPARDFPQGCVPFGRPQVSQVPPRPIIS